MLNITKKSEGTTLEVALEGRLDTTTAPQLEAELKSDLPGVTNLIMDFEKLEYISSAGLRVLLSAQKKIRENGDGRLVVRNASDLVKEVFEVTGFCDILTIE